MRIVVIGSLRVNDVLSNFFNVTFPILDVRGYKVVSTHQICCKTKQLYVI